MIERIKNFQLFQSRRGLELDLEGGLVWVQKWIWNRVQNEFRIIFLGRFWKFKEGGLQIPRILGGSFCQNNVVIMGKITKYSKLEQQWSIEGNDFLGIFRRRDCKVVQKGPGSGRESGTVWKSLLRILQERVCKVRKDLSV